VGPGPIAAPLRRILLQLVASGRLSDEFFLGVYVFDDSAFFFIWLLLDDQLAPGFCIDCAMVDGNLEVVYCFHNSFVQSSS